MPRTFGLAALRVLDALAQGAEYGFDVITATGLPSGTVYPALSRHERDRFVRSSWEDPHKALREGRPPRRYYRLTPEGRKALQNALATFSIGRPQDTDRLRRARPARVRG
jgi:DNA-binding PadR family transcriptional regulator